MQKDDVNRWELGKLFLYLRNKPSENVFYSGHTG